MCSPFAFLHAKNEKETEIEPVKISIPQFSRTQILCCCNHLIAFFVIPLHTLPARRLPNFKDTSI